MSPASADAMRIRRTLPILIALLVVAGVVTAIVMLLGQAPPEAARLLPGADGFVYVNLKWIRSFSSGQLPPVSREPEYQQFVDATGFEFERDLDEAAFSVHYPASWGNGTAGSSPETRFSEVFVGKFDSNRLVPYLKKIAASVDSYRNFDIYNIPQEGRTVRVAVLSYNSVAVSNHPDPAVIRGILDRSRKLASPFGGPSLLRRFYRDVPVASAAFAILRIQPAGISAVAGFSAWSLLFPQPAVAVISARHLRSLHLRAEVFAASDSDAQAIAEKTTTFLSMFHAAEGSVGVHGTDADVKALFDSLKVEHSGDRAIVTATVPPGFIDKILAAAPTGEVPPSPPPPQAPPKPPAKPNKSAKAH
jgi:hypothetical protein